MDSIKKPRALEPPSNNNNEERSRALARQTTQENHDNTDNIHEPSSGATSERESLATSTRYAGMSESMSRLKRVERRDHALSSPNSGTSSFDISTTTNISPRQQLSVRRSNSVSRLKQMDIPTTASQLLTEGCQDATTKTNQVQEEIGVLERKQGWNNRTTALPERQHLRNGKCHTNKSLSFHVTLTQVYRHHETCHLDETRQILRGDNYLHQSLERTPLIHRFETRCKTL